MRRLTAIVSVPTGACKGWRARSAQASQTAREEKLMRRRTYLLLAAVLVALAVLAPAAAETPTIETSTATFGPFVDDESCSSPFTVTVERTRRTIYYEDGDIKRHTDLIVTASADGQTVVQRNSFNVFIDADSPTQWAITGVFEKAQLHGRTLWLVSGSLVYDFEADEVIDAQPGPLAEQPDICELLEP
jgi:hypothetical protein